MSKDEFTIESLLQSRGATFKGDGGCHRSAAERAHLTRTIEDNYPAFEPVRDHILYKNEPYDAGFCNHGHAILDKMHGAGMVKHEDGMFNATDNEVKRYLSGGWLEELAFLAAREANADEVVFSQSVSWKAHGYFGENEIDLIARKGDRLGFTSCKAVSSAFDSDNRKHRNRLMDALHEADNLADHFGKDGDRVAVLCTADLIDEVKDQPRYMALMGKAAVLDVRIIPLEELGWNKLVAALRELIE